MGYIYVLYDGNYSKDVKRISDTVSRRAVRYEFSDHVSGRPRWDRIQKSDAVIVLVTEKLLKSEYALKEIRFAIARNKNILLIHTEQCELIPPFDFLLKDKTSISTDKSNFESVLNMVLSSFEIAYGSKSDTVETPNADRIKIGVVGIGGAGGNILNSLIDAGLNDLLCVAINTDRSALSTCKAHKCLQIGDSITLGYGAGADPQKGKRSAEICGAAISEILAETDLVFIVAGLGAGTGTGAAPVVADIARSMGKTVVAFVTMPFAFEGSARYRSAEQGLQELKLVTDSVITVENEKLAKLKSDMTTEQAFSYVNDILKNCINAVSSIATNIEACDIADSEILRVFRGGGDAVAVTGSACGKNRAEKAVGNAVTQDLFRIDVAVGARRAIVFAEGNEITVESNNVIKDETEQALALIRGMCADDALIVFGCDMHGNSDEFRITIIATDFE